MALSTVSGILTRIGMGKLGRLGLEPAQRYQRADPASCCTSTSRNSDGSRAVPARSAGHQHDTVQTDPPSASEAVGWEYVHVAIDDATRLAYVEVLTDEKAATAVGFLRRAVEHYAARGITIERGDHR